METLAIVLSILCVSVVLDRDSNPADRNGAAALLFLAALGASIYVAVAA